MTGVIRRIGRTGPVLGKVADRRELILCLSYLQVLLMTQGNYLQVVLMTQGNYLQVLLMTQRVYMRGLLVMA